MSTVLRWVVLVLVSVLLPLTAVSRSAGGSIGWVNPNASVDWSRLTNIPSTFVPSSHATNHKNGGSDEVGTTTPANGVIPKAASDGTLNPLFIPVSNAAANKAVCVKTASGSLPTAISVCTDAVGGSGTCTCQ